VLGTDKKNWKQSDSDISRQPEIASCVHRDSEAFYRSDSRQITSSKFSASFLGEKNNPSHMENKFGWKPTLVDNRLLYFVLSLQSKQFSIKY